MSTVDVATLKARAEEFIAKAIAGEATVIEQDGKRAVLLPCEGGRNTGAFHPSAFRLRSSVLSARLGPLRPVPFSSHVAGFGISDDQC